MTFINGNNTIKQIYECLLVKLKIVDGASFYNELLIFLEMLVKRKAIIANWCSLYKATLSQELN